MSTNHKPLSDDPSNEDPVLIYSTFPSLTDAERVGSDLVERGMAACVNIIPGMTSIYVWNGEKHRESETVMIVKTRHGLAGQVISKARRLHPYTNPALLIIPVLGGSEAFCSWIAEQTAAPRIAG